MMEVEENEPDLMSPFCSHLMQKKPKTPREVVEGTARLGCEDRAEHELGEEETPRIDCEELEEGIENDI